MLIILAFPSEFLKFFTIFVFDLLITQIVGKQLKIIVEIVFSLFYALETDLTNENFILTFNEKQNGKIKVFKFLVWAAAHGANCLVYCLCGR